MAHMAMGLGEADFDMSDLPKETSEHGDAPAQGEGTTPAGSTRLSRRRARQRERRRWFRHGPQARGLWADLMDMDDRVQQDLRQAMQQQQQALDALSLKVQDLEAQNRSAIRDLHARAEGIEEEIRGLRKEMADAAEAAEVDFALTDCSRSTVTNVDDEDLTERGRDG